MSSSECPVYEFVASLNDNRGEDLASVASLTNNHEEHIPEVHFSRVEYCTCDGSIDDSSPEGVRAHLGTFHADVVEVQPDLTQISQDTETWLKDNSKGHKRRVKPVAVLLGCGCNDVIDPVTFDVKAHFDVKHRDLDRHSKLPVQCPWTDLHGDVPFPCQDSPQGRSMDRHILFVHILRRSLCPICDECLSRPDAMTRHWTNGACDGFLSLCHGLSERQREELIQRFKEVVYGNRDSYDIANS